MKKLKLALLAAIAALPLLQSCNDDLNDIPTPSNAIKQRGTQEIYFNPISELRDIPINIINLGNTKNKYLSAAPTGNKITVYNRDDGSLRQRWNTFFALQGGNSYNNKPGWVPVLEPSSFNNECNPTLMLAEQSHPFSSVFLSLIPNTSYYHIQHGSDIIVSSSPSLNNPILYLQSTTRTGTGLKFKTTGTDSDLAMWTIQPVGEYKVVDITYLALEEDILSRNDQRVDRATIENGKNESIMYHYMINGSYNESSNFSKTEGISVAVTETVQIGIPIISGSSGSISSTQTSSKSWTFGKSESKTKTVQHSLDIPVPANSRTRVEAYMTSYNLSVTYIATLQSLTSNKTFRVKGKWDGITTSELYCKTWDESTNKLLGIYTF